MAAPSEDNKELKTELDRLREENQLFRMELERYKGLGYSMRKVISNYFSTLKLKAVLAKKKIEKKVFSKSYSKSKAEFKPYRVIHTNIPKKNRPRILHVIGNFYTGGSARLIVDLIEKLGHEYEQEIITRDNPEKPEFEGITIHHFKEIPHISRVYRFLNNYKPDLIHVHYLAHHKDWYSELDWKWYSIFFQTAEKYGYEIIENINIPTEPFISESVKCYVYVSDYVSTKYGRLDSKNVTIYPGSDLSFFSRKPGSAIPDNTIGMVYRLEGDKLNERSIDVFIKVVQQRPGTKAIIIGGGSLLHKYQNAVLMAGVSDAFTFSGYVPYDQLPLFYKQLSIFVAPVHTESFGQVSPFAMGMGIPVVGYNIGALEEIINDQKFLASPGDSNALAEIVIKLLNDRDRRIKIGELNRQRAEQFFSIEAMINEYNMLYNELLNPSLEKIPIKSLLH